MDDTPAIISELIGESNELSTAVGNGWPAVRDTLIDLAARVENEANDESLRRDLDSLLERLLDSAAATIVRAVLKRVRSQGPSDVVRHATQASRPRVSEPESADGAVIVPVFYGTDRAWAGEDVGYSGERGRLEYGVARVSVPPFHGVGKLESPRWWRLEFRPDAAKHVVLLQIMRMAETEFVAHLGDRISGSDAPEALVFVHGYNVSFEQAARRAAQLAVDVKFRGQVALYSWASRANTKMYPADEATIDWSTQNFETFLNTIQTSTGAARVHLLAHSMGSRAVARVLQGLSGTTRPRGAQLSHVMFAAPDIDRDVFREAARAFSGAAERCTLYASSKDLALRVSRMLHAYPRAGDAGHNLLIVDGVDTIDASAVDTSLVSLRHSYFAQRRSILSDVYNLLRSGQPPGSRFDLAPAPGDPTTHWIYRP